MICSFTEFAEVSQGGFEPSTNTLRGYCSTVELLALINSVYFSKQFIICQQSITIDIFLGIIYTSLVKRPESLEACFQGMPIASAELVNRVTNIWTERFGHDPEVFRDIALETVGKVLSLSVEQVTKAAIAVDRLRLADSFLMADSDMPLLQVEQNARALRGSSNPRKELRLALAVRVARRRAAEEAGYDPDDPPSYRSIVKMPGFQEMSRFVTEAVEELAV